MSSDQDMDVSSFQEMVSSDQIFQSLVQKCRKGRPAKPFSKSSIRSQERKCAALFVYAKNWLQVQMKPFCFYKELLIDTNQLKLIIKNFLTQSEQIYDGYSLTHKHRIRFVLFLEHF
jgi:hypothetical protein